MLLRPKLTKKEAMLSFCFFIDFFNKFVMKFFYYFSLELYFRLMLVSFLLFLNHLVFVTTYMQVCSTIKCQIDGSLVKEYFSKSVGSKCWMLTFTLIFFGLLQKRLCWGPCWWWFTRNIWPKTRVACIFCYVWTYLHVRSNKDQVVEKQKKRNRHLLEI